MTDTDTARPQADIRARLDNYRTDNSNDFFGFRQEALAEALDYDHISDLLKDDHNPEEWTPPDVLTTARDYLIFAVGKALGHRGISASRSVEKLEEWVWCLGDDDLLARFTAAPYPQYGAPQLNVLIEAWELTDAELDLADYERDRWARMVDGRHCDPDGCDDGCGL